jgi:NAD(P)-dependent dehydrogenase (short-subunit alcohol dehydrogenase family)
MDVKDKVVLITGGGQGIGRSYALAFAKAQAKVVIFDTHAQNGAAVAEQIQSLGGQAQFFQCDVSQPDAVKQALQGVKDQWGPVQVLINNAAVFVTLGRQAFEDIPLAEWEQVMRVNVTGSWVCASAVAADMKRAQWGRIIQISSSTVPLGTPMFMHYVTSKSAVIGMTRAMATELGPHGITVNCVLPGLTDTEVDNPGRTDAMRQKIIDMQCVKRIGRPDDMVGTMLFLASDASAFVTGQSIAVDGGSVFL